jgi:hypothetical protein
MTEAFMRGKKKIQTLKTKPVRSSISRSSVVDAVVIQSPDLGLNLKIQNLLNFFVESIKELRSSQVLSGVLPQDLNVCIQHIRAVQSDASFLNDEVKKLLNEFIDEIDNFANLTAAFCCPCPEKSVDPVDIVLSAKSSRLQWLAVCLLEELKRSFNKS